MPASLDLAALRLEQLTLMYNHSMAEWLTLFAFVFLRLSDFVLQKLLEASKF